MIKPITRVRMIDVSEKPDVARQATASGKLRLKQSTIARLSRGSIEKGDPFSTAEIAAIMAAKNTSLIIPLCHQLPITTVRFDARLEKDGVLVRATVKTTGKTGVEMEALVAVATYLLTIWDMTKKYEKDEKGQYPHTMIENIKVTKKEKGSVRRRIDPRA